MKKTILLAALFVSMTSTAFALQTFDFDTGSDIGSTPFKTSTKVTLIADSTTTSYSVAAKHEQGTTCYFSSNTAATIDESVDNPLNKGVVVSDATCTAGMTP